RIRQRPADVREVILATLDEWDGLASDPKYHIKEPHLAWLRAVREAVELADSWQRKFDAAMNNPSMEERTKAALRLPPRWLIAFAQSVARSSPPHAAELLQRAQRLHPNDFWINEELGQVLRRLSPPPWAESVRYLSVAVALRPDSAGAIINLAG